MCGIVGYLGNRQAEPVLMEGLRRLEYRGYDSAGVAAMHEGDILVRKAVGKVAMLGDAILKAPLPGNVGIAHTRWATHGVPSETNAHPHVDCSGAIAVVHNGIIENHAALRAALEKRGHTFRSETDSEVVAHLVEERVASMSVESAFFAALKQIEGTFGIAMIANGPERKVYAARRGSPLVIGLGAHRDEWFIASDPAAIVSYTKEVIYLDDDEVAVLTEGGVETYTIDRAKKDKSVESVDWTIEEIERGKFPHFMLKEINEQPQVIIDATRGRLDHENGRAVLGGLKDVEERLRDVERITIVACGSAYLAGAIGEYMLEEYAEIPTEVQIGSEFRYRKPILDPKKEIVIAVSQSGETADTLGALREAKERGVLTLGIVNAVGSTVARETDAGVYTHAGPEIAVASTKAFVAQATVFALLSMFLGRQRKMSHATGVRIAKEIAELPEKIESILANDADIAKIAKKYTKHQDALFLGRKYNAPVAFEGALKLKEISYIHAEGFAAGEMKHGPIALLDESFPVIGIATQDSVYEKMRSNLEEVRARKAPVVVLATEGDESMLSVSDDVIYVPKTIEMLSPILNVIPLQMFAYHVAVARGYDPDRPRNLAKSVTVE
jgi:glucosamine--fructose-6-phosphate aminotransferase (isomerizing)